MREIVTHFDDPRLADYRNVPDPELLTERGIFIAEGRLVVSRLLASPRYPVRSLMVTGVAAEALAEALERRSDVPVYEVPQQTMNQVAGFNIHRGCLAIGERPPALDPTTLATGAAKIIALEGVSNADNVGGIFRNAAAFGADGVLLDDASTDPLYRKALRTSMGAVLQMPFARTATWLSTLGDYRRAGLRLVALTPRLMAPALDRVVAELAGARLLLVVGHEGDGLTAATMDACDLHARIPMQPGIDSLNVAVAVAIALYETSRFTVHS